VKLALSFPAEVALMASVVNALRERGLPRERMALNIGRELATLQQMTIRQSGSGQHVHPEMQLRSNRSCDRARTGFGYRPVYGSAVVRSVGKGIHGAGQACCSSADRETAVAFGGGRCRAGL
jgi:hypothetical protein